MVCVLLYCIVILLARYSWYKLWISQVLSYELDTSSEQKLDVIYSCNVIISIYNVFNTQFSSL